SVAVFARALCAAAILIVLGHYVEYVMRRFLIGRRLWGVPTAVVGGEASWGLAEALRAQPEYGLRPIGFIADSDDVKPRRTYSHLGLLGRLSDSERLSAI